MDGLHDSHTEKSSISDRRETTATKEIPDAELDDVRGESVIYPNGNLVLIVGGKSCHRPPRKMILHYDTLRHVNSNWEEELAKSKSEGLFSRRRIHHLPDDNADMVLILMWASHPWHFAKVPRQLSFSQLLAMAVTCNKYDMNMQVSPYLAKWIAPHQSKLLAPRCEKWLNIAYQFGLERHYVALVQHLALNCRADRDGALYVPDRHERLSERIPKDGLGMCLNEWKVGKDCVI